MGRRKNYDRDTIVAQALGVFHERGFQRATTEALVEALGVNRFSLYSEFGSKGGLFDACMEIYEQAVVDQLFGPLEAPDASLDEIRALFETFAVTAAPSSGRGCLMINTAAELGGCGSDAQPRIDRYFERLRGAFCNALAGGQACGQLPAILDISAEADFLAAATVGVFVMVRSGAPSVIAEGAIAGALRHIDVLDPRATTTH